MTVAYFKILNQNLTEGEKHFRRFHKRRGISCPFEGLPYSQERLLHAASQLSWEDAVPQCHGAMVPDSKALPSDFKYRNALRCIHGNNGRANHELLNGWDSQTDRQTIKCYVKDTSRPYYWFLKILLQLHALLQSAQKVGHRLSFIITEDNIRRDLTGMANMWNPLNASV